MSVAARHSAAGLAAPLAPLARSVLHLCSGRGASGHLSILIYHRVHGAPDPLNTGDPDVDTFRWQMDLVRRCCNLVSLPEALARMDEDALPPGALAVTFDDGYQDNLDRAAPILTELGVPATFFIATGYLDGALMWNDVVKESLRAAPPGRYDLRDIEAGDVIIDGSAAAARAAIAIIRKWKYLPPETRSAHARVLHQRCGNVELPRLMLDPPGVRRMSDAGFTIGAHTVNHPILATIDAERARSEIADSREQLRALTGTPVELFAYPNGRPQQDFRDEHAAMARAAGFSAAVSTAPGVSSRTTDRFQLRRFTPWDRTPARFAMRLAANWTRRA